MPVIISRPASGGGGGGVTPVTGSVSGFATRSDLNAQSLSVSPSGGTAPYSYSWSCVRPDGTSSTSEFDVTNAASVSFTPERVGLYSVSCVITDSAGSPQNLTVSATAKVGSDLSVSLGGFTSTTDLAAQSLTSTPTNGTGGYSYAWTVTKPDGTSGAALLSSTTDQNPTLTPTAKGLHSVSVTVTDSSSQTATASDSRDLGTGIPDIGQRQQITGLAGWTAFTGASCAADFSSNASITESGGEYTLSWSGLSANPVLQNAPKEVIGFYSPASLLQDVDFSGASAGVLTLRLETQTQAVGTDSGGLDTPGELMVGIGLCSKPYDGDDTTVDFVHSYLWMDANAGGASKPYTGGGGETASLNAGTTRTIPGIEILDLNISINADGNPTALQTWLYTSSTTYAQNQGLTVSGTTAFSSDDDVRFVLMLGSQPSSARAASVGVRLYWSYHKNEA